MRAQTLDQIRRECVEYSPTWITASIERGATFSKFSSMAWGVWSTEAMIPPESQLIIHFLAMQTTALPHPSFSARKATSNPSSSLSTKVRGLIVCGLLEVLIFSCFYFFLDCVWLWRRDTRKRDCVFSGFDFAWSLRKWENWWKRKWN